MTTILAFLSFALFITLIVGLVKPSLILRWTNKPTRLKVFGYWVLAAFLIGIITVATENDQEKAKSSIEAAKNYIEKENYSSAISKLENIDKENPLYSEAQLLLQKVDSLNKITEGERQLAKEVETKKVAEDKKNNQKERLEREIKSVNDGVDFSTYRGTIDALQMELVLFGTWANIISEGENSNDPEVQKLTKQLKAKVVSMQIKEFPKLRKDYSNIVAKKMWENDIEVTVDGANNKYINFSGGIFAANKNKQDFQNEVHKVLEMFRFNQSRYRWYKGADEYTYWTIYEGKDSDLVAFDK
ncbi:MAG: hypothetical protein KF870_13255 [Leadbetterella sp.]|nr:hypothetical protein [Leadbetterella sp.]